MCDIQQCSASSSHPTSPCVRDICPHNLPWGSQYRHRARFGVILKKPASQESAYWDFKAKKIRVGFRVCTAIAARATIDCGNSLLPFQGPNSNRYMSGENCTTAFGPKNEQCKISIIPWLQYGFSSIYIPS